MIYLKKIKQKIIDLGQDHLPKKDIDIHIVDDIITIIDIKVEEEVEADQENQNKIYLYMKYL